MDDVIDCGGRKGAGELAPGLSTLSDDELTITYDAVLTQSRQAEWQRLAVEAEIDRRGMYRTDGTRSLREWIATRTGEGERAAYHHATVARSLTDYPQLSAALAGGDLSFPHTRLLLILGDLTDITDRELVAIGATHTVPQLETACRAARRHARDADTNSHAGRYVRWRRDNKGTFYFNARLHGTDALVVTNLLTAIAEAARPDPITGEHTSFETRCADALVDVCSPDDTTRPDRADVVVHVPLSALPASVADQHENPDRDQNSREHKETSQEKDSDQLEVGVAMTWDGTTISTDALSRLLCDSRLRLTIEDLEGNAVGIGRLSKNIPEWLAAQVRWRDQACRFPGCEETRWLHNHHIRHWTENGPTDLTNLALLCRAHHKIVHEGPWRIHGNPNGPLHFTGPHRQRLTTHPAVRPPRLRHRRSRPSRRPPLSPTPDADP
jgi:hypothetical protein